MSPPCMTDDYHVRASLSDGEYNVCLETTYEDGRVVCIRSHDEGYTPLREEYICVDFDTFVRAGAAILAEKDAAR